jgi:A/G-specific adenine glycosylase
VTTSSFEIEHISAESISQFQEQILAWYDTFKRDLPWRGDSDPYHILVSEIMLQQTQVGRLCDNFSRSLLGAWP